jgi:hypothetical protein
MFGGDYNLKVFTHDIFLSIPLSHFLRPLCPQSLVLGVSHSEAFNTPGCFRVIAPREGVARHDAAVSNYFPRVGLLVQ